MTLNSPETESNSGENQDRLWLVCPICKNPNPSGTLHCKYCWGPSLYAVDPINTGELADFTEQYRKKQKKLSLFRNLLVYIGAPLLLVGGILFWLYNFTDLVFAPPVNLNSSSFPGESAMFRYDTGRTGATSLTAMLPVGELKWTFQTAGPINSSPVVIGETVYIGSNDGKLYALDANTGQEKWRFTTGSWVESTPAIVNGMIFFGSNDGKFYALDAGTGYEIWSFDTGRPVKSSPAIANGIAYFGSFDSYLYAMDAKTGSLIWKYKTNSYIMSSPVIHNGILYVGSNDNSCYALNAGDGRFRVKLTHKEVLSSPSINGDTTYFTSERFLVAMDGKARNWPLETPIRYWWNRLYLARIVPPPPPMTGLLWATRISYYNTNSAPVFDEGNIYTTGDNRVYRVDAETHKIVWTYTAGGFVSAAPALAHGVVFAGAENGSLYAIGAENGELFWEYATGGQIIGSPTYAKGVVYVASSNGTLYALE